MDEPFHAVIGDISTVAEMDIVQVLSQLGDSVNSYVRDIAALG